MFAHSETNLFQELAELGGYIRFRQLRDVLRNSTEIAAVRRSKCHNSKSVKISSNITSTKPRSDDETYGRLSSS